MGNQPAFAQGLIVLIDLLATALAGGLIVAFVVQPQRDKRDLFFIIFGLAVTYWNLGALLRDLPDLLLPMATVVGFNLLLTALVLTAATFYLFVFRFVGAQDRLAQVFLVGGVIFCVISGVLIWSDLAVQPNLEGDGLALTTLGYIPGVGAVIYGLLGLWLALSSRDPEAKQIYLPAVLLSVGLVLALLPVPVVAFWANSVATLAALLLGVVLLRRNLSEPVADLKAELRTANQDLRQALSDLAVQRDKSDQLNRELQSASGYKNQFLNNMGHKLRTPLNSIVGYSELLESGIYGDLTDKQGDRLEKITRNSRKLLNLINNMIDLSEIETGQMELNWQPLHMDALSQQCIASVEPQRAEKDIELTVAVEPDLFKLYGDEARIQQIVAELLSNAIKYTTVGQVTLKAQNVVVANGQSESFKLPVIGWLRDGVWVVITVVDTGVGIPAEDQSKIFEDDPDQYAALDSNTDGSGLGLIVTKKLVELHKGVIWLRSAPDQGSSFFVALPAHQDEQTKSPLAELQTAAG